jgi:hypothetical protein
LLAAAAAGDKDSSHRQAYGLPYAPGRTAEAGRHGGRDRDGTKTRALALAILSHVQQPPDAADLAVTT